MCYSRTSRFLLSMVLLLGALGLAACDGSSSSDPSIHGVGVAGIREWKRLALEYLTAHPGELLPVGQVGDQLDVVRQTVQLVREA